MNSIRARQERYYRIFGIPTKSVGGGKSHIENEVSKKEAAILKSIMNPVKLRSTISCDDKYNKSKLLKIIVNNVHIAKRMK